MPVRGSRRSGRARERQATIEVSPTYCVGIQLLLPDDQPQIDTARWRGSEPESLALLDVLPVIGDYLELLHEDGSGFVVEVAHIRHRLVMKDAPKAYRQRTVTIYVRRPATDDEGRRSTGFWDPDNPAFITPRLRFSPDEATSR